MKEQPDRSLLVREAMSRDHDCRGPASTLRCHEVEKGSRVPLDQWCNYCLMIALAGKSPLPASAAPDFRVLASAMKKMLPPALMAEVVAHLDPLTPFVAFLRGEVPASAAGLSCKCGTTLVCPDIGCDDNKPSETSSPLAPRTDETR